MNDGDDKVRYAVKMRRQLREDGKRNAERGELAEEVRAVFRRKAYGAGAVNSPTEVERTKAELREVRDRIDELRQKRGRIETEIEAQESRAARLEERLESLEADRDELEQSAEMLENMLHDGARMWPTRIKNAADVDADVAEELYQRLQDKNPELPPEAFEEPALSDPTDWRETDGRDADANVHST